jgi:hypothetical protein
MKKISLILASVTATALLTGCSNSQHPVPTYDVTKVDFSKQDTWKQGESCKGSILTIIPTGFSNSVKDAAKNGDISEVIYTEQDTLYIPILYTKNCVTVYGK